MIDVPIHKSFIQLLSQHLAKQYVLRCLVLVRMSSGVTGFNSATPINDITTKWSQLGYLVTVEATGVVRLEAYVASKHVTAVDTSGWSGCPDCCLVHLATSRPKLLAGTCY